MSDNNTVTAPKRERQPRTPMPTWVWGVLLILLGVWLVIVAMVGLSDYFDTDTVIALAWVGYMVWDKHRRYRIEKAYTGGRFEVPVRAHTDPVLQRLYYEYGISPDHPDPEGALYAAISNTRGGRHPSDTPNTPEI